MITAIRSLILSNWCEQCLLSHSLTLYGHVLSDSLMQQIAFAILLGVCVCVVRCIGVAGMLIFVLRQSHLEQQKHPD